MRLIRRLVTLFTISVSNVASYFTSFVAGSELPINTAVSNSMSADGLTWAQAFPIQRDKYGNIIINTQRNTGGRRVWTYSNDDGVTWIDNTAINDLSDLGEISTRTSFIYDAVNDCLHGLLYYNNEVVVYRRYGITYSGTSISSITWTRGSSPNVVLHSDNSLEFAHPVILLLNQVIIACWGNTGNTKGDVIVVRCNISSDIDAVTLLSNWVHIGVSSTTTSGSVPLTASYTLVSSAAIVTNPYPSMTLAANNDLLFTYYKVVTQGRYYYQRLPYSAGNWSLGTEIIVSTIRVSGTNSGYSLKQQLMTSIIEVGTNVFFAAPVWQSNALGDSFVLFKITSGGTVTSVVVNSALGAHSYAPTGDLSYIDTRLVVSYLTTAQATYFIAYDPSDLSVVVSPELIVGSTNPCDIPLLSKETINDKILLMYRVIGTPPQIGKFMFVDLV